MTAADAFTMTVTNLRRLKLSTIRESLEDNLRLAQAKMMTHLEFLHGLTAQELKGREESNYRRRLKAAHLPIEKTLEGFDVVAQPAVSRERLQGLGECRWVANAENLVLAGPPGTGKTHLAIALAREGLAHGYSVFFTGVAELMDQVGLAQISGQLGKLQKKLAKVEVLVLDELGYLKLTREQGNFLFRVVSTAYEQQSLVVTTNKDFSGWSEIFPDAVQVTALLDRLLHHCQVLSLKGESYRVRKAGSGSMANSSAKGDQREHGFSAAEGQAGLRLRNSEVGKK